MTTKNPVSIIDTTGSTTGQVIQSTGAGNAPAWAGLAASSVSYNQGSTGAVTVTQQAKNQQVVSVMDFGAVGDGITDDMAAFQLAANEARLLGAKRILCPNAKYYLGSYTTATVPNVLGVAYTGTSSCVVLPSNCTLEGDSSLTELNFLGGSTSPFGYPLSVNLGSFSPEGNTSTNATFVSMNPPLVSVVSTAGLVVGQVVQLGRLGGNVAGVPNTPSQEISPHQILSIASISGTNVTFNEAFFQRFDSAQGLILAASATSGANLHKDVYLKNLKFTGSPYVLLSRTLGTGFLGKCSFVSPASFSIGSSQRVKVESLHIIGTTCTIESCSEVDIENVYADGYGSSSALGGLYINDNCRKVLIGKITANNYTNTGIAILYGVDAVIGEVETNNCGTSAVGDSFSAALSMGFPAVGAHPSLQVAEATAYKVQNSGTSRIMIRSFKNTGASSVALRSHDVDLVIDKAYIEYVGATGSPFSIGQSGVRRADATWFPAGGVAKTLIGSLAMKTLSGAQYMPSFNNGTNGAFHGYQTTLTASASAGSTTLSVADPSVFLNGDTAYYLNEAGTNFYPTAITVTSVTSSSIGVSALPYAMANGQGIWSFSTALRDLLSRTVINEFILDSVQVPIASGQQFTELVFSTGSGPYTTTFTTAPPSAGEWLLEVQIISNDKAHYASAQYSVSYSTLNGTYPLSDVTQIFKKKIRTNVDIPSVPTISGNTVTVTVQASASGIQASVFYKWTPQRPILSQL